MTKDDIIRMAREAGFVVNEKARQHQPNCIFHTQYMVDELLERFAALIIANHPPQSSMAWQEGNEAGRLAEREACAQLCERMWHEWLDLPEDSDKPDAEDCYRAIRARGNT